MFFLLWFNNATEIISALVIKCSILEIPDPYLPPLLTLVELTVRNMICHVLNYLSTASTLNGKTQFYGGVDTQPSGPNYLVFHKVEKISRNTPSAEMRLAT